MDQERLPSNISCEFCVVFFNGVIKCELSENSYFWKPLGKIHNPIKIIKEYHYHITVMTTDHIQLTTSTVSMSSASSPGTSQTKHRHSSTSSSIKVSAQTTSVEQDSKPSTRQTTRTTTIFNIETTAKDQTDVALTTDIKTTTKPIQMTTSNRNKITTESQTTRNLMETTIPSQTNTLSIGAIFGIVFGSLAGVSLITGGLTYLILSVQKQNRVINLS